MGTVNDSQSVSKIKEQYNKELNLWLEKQSALKKRYVFIAWLRLAFFVSSFSVPFGITVAWTLPFFLLFAILFSGFIGLVWYAGKITARRNYYGKRIELLEKELLCSKGNWTGETDGEELIEYDHKYAHDLDLFGKGSLFQFINRTSTNGGYKRLAHKLKNISFSGKDIKSKQNAVKELAAKDEYRQHFYALGALIEDNNKNNRSFDVANKPDLSFISRSGTFLAFSYLSLMVLAVILIIAGVLPSLLITYLFFGGLTISGFHLKKINKVHNEVTSLGNYLNRYALLIQHVEQNDFTSDYLNEVKNNLSNNGKTAGEILLHLARLIKLLDQRLNMIMGVVLNGFFLWDFIVSIRLKIWYNNYGDKLSVWLDTLHELEAMNSLATFAYNHPHYTYPVISDKTVMEAGELGHPLIPVAERVSNDFAIDDTKRISIVTGANMAGKSTFLRTVGVSLVLAGTGCVVSAKKFLYKPMLLMTNMRVADNLMKHESYFFAELSRLKMTVDNLKETGELFFILDEILKGTNSHDKTQGSIALTKQLLQLHGCGLIATHDLELGQMAGQFPGRIFNNCFEVTFEEDGLNFDYKLRDGVTKSHNASFLMKKMGLIPKDMGGA